MRHALDGARIETANLDRVRGPPAGSITKALTAEGPPMKTNRFFFTAASCIHGSWTSSRGSHARARRVAAHVLHGRRTRPSRSARSRSCQKPDVTRLRATRPSLAWSPRAEDRLVKPVAIPRRAHDRAARRRSSSDASPFGDSQITVRARSARSLHDSRTIRGTARMDPAWQACASCSILFTT